MSAWPATRSRPASFWRSTARSTCKAFALANPNRIVVDVPQISFQLPVGVGEASRGLVKAFRYGLVMPGGSRIVMDLKRPAKIDKAYVLEGENGQLPKLIVELSATDRAAFHAGDRCRESQGDGCSHAGNDRGEPQRRPAAADASDKRPVVVIDPGHGGIDHGTQAQAARTKRPSFSISPRRCANASRRAASTAW